MVEHKRKRIVININEIDNCISYKLKNHGQMRRSDSPVGNVFFLLLFCFARHVYLFVCVDALRPIQHFFSLVGTIFYPIL